MTDSVRYIITIDAICRDGNAPETLFRSPGDVLKPSVRLRWHLARLWQGLSHWQMRRAGRLALHDLTDDQLRDIGLTRIDAEREIQKSRLLML